MGFQTGSRAASAYLYCLRLQPTGLSSSHIDMRVLCLQFLPQARNLINVTSRRLLVWESLKHWTSAKATSRRRGRTENLSVCASQNSPRMRSYYILRMCIILKTVETRTFGHLERECRPSPSLEETATHVIFNGWRLDKLLGGFGGNKFNPGGYTSAVGEPRDKCLHQTSCLGFSRRTVWKIS
ncbi:uncharacterized protein BJX67DRAFT_307321 [Aspergillus lucknowensis]|uniref:Uncharacterized protein n=1 Tax=Aspergillus lucknowensis TaxID=176173 RepID=A0ABR4M004_9EURO